MGRYGSGGKQAMGSKRYLPGKRVIGGDREGVTWRWMGPTSLNQGQSTHTHLTRSYTHSILLRACTRIYSQVHTFTPISRGYAHLPRIYRTFTPAYACPAMLALAHTYTRIRTRWQLRMYTHVHAYSRIFTHLHASSRIHTH